jgi:anthranilate phosphoribosyltransferase
MTELLAVLGRGEALNEDQAAAAFERVMTGGATEAQIGALLAAMQARPGGPTIDEIVGAARIMRRHAKAIDVPAGLDVIDTCGTGGDASGTFNISTTAALIAAGAGARVAKHGNRSVTSASGSSQVLEALGVNLGVADGVHGRCLEESGLCFCFAPAHHPAMKHAIGPRKQLGFRTVFNVLGPLTNPAGAKRQVIGVFENRLTETLARVLQRLGAVHAMVVHGQTLAAPDTTHGGLGLDELTPTGPTRITILKDGRIDTSEMHPGDVGLSPASVDDLRISSIDGSAELIRRLLEGEPGPARDIACLNAAAALVVADLAPDLNHGIKRAREALDNGAAKRSLEKLVALTNG